ncbi:hypothetical protein APHAL10511_002716 [Amanita phalloides]|nr:hypothetical protein APHAL10511_002716 [Amanita phalloides]
MSSAKSLFTKGVSAFQAGTYQDALRFFTEALSHHDQQHEQPHLYYSIYDSRAATYQRMDRLNDALRDVKRAMDLVPSRWQAYARAARLLLQTRRFDAALKMANRALARLDANSPIQRRTELESIRAMALSNGGFIQPVCYISLLPTELLVEIFCLATAHDHTMLACTILRVCRHWRRVAWDCPALWTTLVVGPSPCSRREPKKKAKAWLLRSNGHIRDLQVYANAVIHKDWRDRLEEELKSLKWDGLRSLTIESWNIVGYLESFSSEKTLGFLEKLKVIDNISAQRWDSLLSAACQVTELTLDGVRCDLESISSRTLRHVVLRYCDHGQHHIFKLFERQPSLETLTALELSNPHPQPWTRAEPLNLDHITHIDLSGCYFVSLVQLQTPNLRVLRIARSGNPLNGSFFHLAGLNLPNFEELVLSRVSCDPGPLVAFLESVPTLMHLALMGVQGLASGVVEALASRNRINSESASQTHLPCPRLEHIDVSESPDLKSASLVRLVKSRLLDNQEERATARIQSLKMDGCPRIEPDLLPWFRQHVPTVSCVYLSKKDPAWRR